MQHVTMPLKRVAAWAGVALLVETAAEVVVAAVCLAIAITIVDARSYAVTFLALDVLCVSRYWRLLPGYRARRQRRVAAMVDRIAKAHDVRWTPFVMAELEAQGRSGRATDASAAASAAGYDGFGGYGGDGGVSPAAVAYGCLTESVSAFPMPVFRAPAQPPQSPPALATAVSPSESRVQLLAVSSGGGYRGPPLITAGATDDDNDSDDGPAVGDDLPGSGALAV